MSTLKHLRCCASALLLALGLSMPFKATAQSGPGNLPLELMPNKLFSDVQTQASFDALSSPVYSNSPTALPFHTTFTGSVTADATMTKMAIFSDDGCDVYVNGTRVWNALDKPQALPDLVNSLHELPITLTPGQTYTIRIDYSNVIYSPPDPTTGKPLDIDGCTLYMYGSDTKSYYLYVDNDSDDLLAGNGRSNLSTTSIDAYVEDEQGNPVPGVKVNFTSVYEDSNGNVILTNGRSTPAGTIGVVNSGDSFVTDSNGQAQVTLTAANMVGQALVTASAVLPDQSSQSDETDIAFDAPVAQFDYSPDGWLPVKGGSELGTTVTVTFDGTALPNLPLNLTAPVYNGSNPVQGSASWSSFDNASPTTDANGQCQVNLLWTPGTAADPTAPYVIVSGCADPEIVN